VEVHQVGLIYHNPDLEHFYVISPPDPLALVAKGWREHTAGLFVATDPLAVIEFEHLFSRELQDKLGTFTRVRQPVSEEEWSAVIPPGLELLAHQRSGVQYLLGARPGHSTLLADPPGAGKTCTIAVYLNFQRPHDLLIVCPANVKYNWPAEMAKWGADWYGQRHIEICESKTAEQNIANIRAAWMEDKGVVVYINYDILKKFESVLYDPDIVWDDVIFDEAHKLKNLDTKRAMFCLGKNAGGGIRFTRRVFASATSLNRPVDFWSMARACDPTRLGSDYMDYVERYCGATMVTWRSPKGATGQRLNVTGKSNVEELGFLAAQSFMIRHETDHLLPPYREETVMLAPTASLRTAEQQVFDEIFGADEVDEDIKQAKLNIQLAMFRKAGELGLDIQNLDANGRAEIIGATFAEQAQLFNGVPLVFQMISKLREVTGQAKLPHIIEQIQLMREQDETSPIVVMCYHTDVVKQIAEAFEGEAAVVVGGVTAKKRADIVRRFQAGEVPIFIGNILAAGEGITLTRSCRLLFGEVDWNATSMWQALKRIHRITQASDVTITYLLFDNSIDGNIAKRYISKRETINEFFHGSNLYIAANTSDAEQGDRPGS
jgi:hypothetical protein